MKYLYQLNTMQSSGDSAYTIKAILPLLQNCRNNRYTSITARTCWYLLLLFLLSYSYSTQFCLPAHLCWSKLNHSPGQPVLIINPLLKSFFSKFFSLPLIIFLSSSMLTGLRTKQFTLILGNIFLNSS
jgi:hypothetical protein